MKFISTKYTNNKDILKFPDHYVAIAITVDDDGVVADSITGKKIVAAGTIIGGGFLLDDTKKAKKDNSATAEGVLLNEVDVTYGPVQGAAIVHGFIANEKLPEQPSDEAVKILKMIEFIK